MNVFHHVLRIRDIVESIFVPLEKLKIVKWGGQHKAGFKMYCISKFFTNDWVNKWHNASNLQQLFGHNNDHLFCSFIAMTMFEIMWSPLDYIRHSCSPSWWN